MSIRTPIVAVLGHVDHGKTTLLDKIRRTRVAAKEAGGITQHIGATEVPLEIIKNICKDIWNVKVKVPGLLFIDTPGHKAFTNLRRRGGALADLAVLVIDVIEGFKPQTEESLSILRTFKTPFVIAANKIDKIPGWQIHEDYPFSKTFELQEDNVKNELEKKLYKIIGDLYNFGFSADRFDRIRDFTRTVAVIPVSAVSGEGIPELLMVLIGLAQRYLEKSLKIKVRGRAKGTILEVKEEKGLGITCDVILYDGTLKVGDRIAIAGRDRTVITHVKGILKPRPAKEIRMESRFKGVRSVSAAAGVKIVAPNLEDVLAGSEFEVIESKEDLKKFEERIRKEYESIAVRTESEGVILKTDTVGSLEALIGELKGNNVPIRKAEVGDIDKNDVIDASANKLEENRIILGFNVKVLPNVEMEARKYGVKIVKDNVIYSLVETCQKIREDIILGREMEKMKALIKPAKIKLLRDYIFRRSKPAIVGVRVLAGEIRKNLKLIKQDGTPAGVIRSMQKEGQAVNVAKEGDELAIAIDGVMIGRHLKGDEVLYVDVPEKHVRVFREELYDTLSDNAKRVLNEILEIKKIKA